MTITSFTNCAEATYAIVSSRTAIKVKHLFKESIILPFRY